MINVHFSDPDSFQKKSRLLPIKLNSINVELLEESESLCRNAVLTPMFLKTSYFKGTGVNINEINGGLDKICQKICRKVILRWPVKNNNGPLGCLVKGIKVTGTMYESHGQDFPLFIENLQY